MHPPFAHYQTTFSVSRGEERPYCDVVTGKVAESVIAPSSAVDLSSLPTSLVKCTDFSILVGMHSDQATEEIVDLAIMHDMPFAVVPCCVFPKLFTHRKIPVAIYRKLLNRKRTEYADILYPVQSGDEADTPTASNDVLKVHFNISTSY